MKIVSALLLSAALVAGLAGCAASATSTVPASAIASTAGRALENAAGLSAPPKVTCGKTGFSLHVGTKITCDVVDPTNGKDYDATVTITKITGAKFSLHVQVAKTPNN
ncbi:MAG TPA: DUF4333 domain-containing protein [Galbitalea sp.]|jgi:hypothetical protein|nr:DUF4333 domain-containing protein [Galbitalea sp.]